MDFFEVVQTRQSIRAYQDQPIEPEKLQADSRDDQSCALGGQLAGLRSVSGDQP